MLLAMLLMPLVEVNPAPGPTSCLPRWAKKRLLLLLAASVVSGYVTYRVLGPSKTATLDSSNTYWVDEVAFQHQGSDMINRAKQEWRRRRDSFAEVLEGSEIDFDFAKEVADALFGDDVDVFHFTKVSPLDKFSPFKGGYGRFNTRA